MKLIGLFAAVLLIMEIVAAPSHAYAQDSELVDGLVVKIDESAQKITIKHGPLKKFEMDEGMTMVFRAGDSAMLNTVKPGDKVRFLPDRVNGQFTVTKIEKTK